MSEEKQDLKVCVVGAGNHSTRSIYPYIGKTGQQIAGDVHQLETYLRYEDLTGGYLAGVCDLDRRKAERNARRFGGRAYTDMVEMLDAEKPDAVIICIGPEANVELGTKVLKRGIPLYVEKPPAPSAADTLALARVAKEAGMLCMTAFKKRYASAFNRAREWLGKFPPDALSSITIVGNQDRIHLVDLLCFLGGDVNRVFACDSANGVSRAATVAFTCGAVGCLDLCGRAWGIPGEEVEITVAGGNAMTIHNSASWRITEDSRCCEWREPSTYVGIGDSGNDSGHLTEIVEFLAAIQEGRTTRSNMYESYKSMVLFEALQKSAQSRDAVEIGYEPL
jgi:predicted dehydrogenase